MLKDSLSLLDFPSLLIAPSWYVAAIGGDPKSFDFHKKGLYLACIMGAVDERYVQSISYEQAHKITHHLNPQNLTRSVASLSKDMAGFVHGILHQDTGVLAQLRVTQAPAANLQCSLFDFASRVIWSPSMDTLFGPGVGTRFALTPACRC